MIVWFGQSVVAAHRRSVGSRRCTVNWTLPSYGLHIRINYYELVAFPTIYIYVYCNVFPCYRGVFWHLVSCVWQSSACVAWYGTDEGIILIRCLGNVTQFSYYLTAFSVIIFQICPFRMFEDCFFIWVWKSVLVKLIPVRTQWGYI